MKKLVSKLNEIPPRYVAIVIFFVLLAGYGLFQTKNLILGPNIAIASPANGAAVGLNPVEVKGQADRIAFISLNGEQIFTDKEGNFSQKLLLNHGYNIIKLEAQDKFGRTIEKVLNLVYE
jgi:hypothetical protein